ncbi:prevent-host-death family protein [Pasteurellaceae bacterium Macca]|nr:prevent-host-death family protein [Pasteurellaceae bacterium Macca]
MAITVTSKEFNQRASQVLKWSEEQPVFITKWGKVVSVLSSYADYQQTKQAEPSFEQIFTEIEEDVNDHFFTEFEQALSEIRHTSSLRSVELD